MQGQFQCITEAKRNAFSTAPIFHRYSIFSARGYTEATYCFNYTLSNCLGVTRKVRVVWVFQPLSKDDSKHCESTRDAVRVCSKPNPAGTQIDSSVKSRGTAFENVKTRLLSIFEKHAHTFHSCRSPKCSDVLRNSICKRKTDSIKTAE